MKQERSDGPIDPTPARVAIAAVLRRLRQWRDQRERTRGRDDFLVAALRWLGRLIAVYVAFWTSRRTVAAWCAATVALLAVEAYYDWMVAAPYRQVMRTPERTQDGSVQIAAEVRVKEGFYTHYDFSKELENPGGAIGSTPACRPFYRFGHEASRIVWIMLKAPATAFIDTVIELPKLDMFQWFVASRLLGNVPVIGPWLDANGALTARCAGIVVPVPEGMEFDRIENAVMFEEPEGTTGCNSGPHVVRIGLDEIQGCGWMTVSRPKKTEVNGRPAVALEIKNWLHDDWPVDRVVQATVVFRPAVGR